MQRGTGLLPWTVESEELTLPLGPLPDIGDGALMLSVVDRIAAPTAFMHQALVFERALNGAKMRTALAEVLGLFPTMGCRASKGQDGEWLLNEPRAGAMFTLGSSDATIQCLAPQPPRPLAEHNTNIGAELFGHLPPVLPGSERAEAASVPLLHLSHVALAAGGSVLGLRVSHLVGDFGTLRCVLHHLARAYSGRPLSPADGAPAPAAPLVAALAAATQLPPGHEPWNYRPLPPDVGSQLAALRARPPLQCLTLAITPGQLEALKAQAMADLQAVAISSTAVADGVDGRDEGGPAVSSPAANGQPGDCGSNGGGAPWVSSNDALMAWLWQSLARLPCRAATVTPFNLALDMRTRMQLPPGHHSTSSGVPPRWVYGNLATSAFCPELDAAALPLGQVALALRQTVIRDATKFASDVAFATRRAASGGSCSSLAILPVLRILEAVGGGQVPLLMASQWALDHRADADFAGHLPVACCASFGSALMFPVAVSQPAPPAAGGGVVLRLWLWPDEARELATAVRDGGISC